MAKPTVPKSLQRILLISLALIFISTVVIVAIGQSIKNMYAEIDYLKSFMENSEQIQPDFERSLEVYTEETTHIIQFLQDLRPSTEEDLVKAISSIEEAAKSLSLDINLKSIDQEIEATDSIDYQLSYYGTMIDNQNFLRELEKLSLYIKIEELSFKDVKFLDATDLDAEENIKMRIKLYTK